MKNNPYFSCKNIEIGSWVIYENINKTEVGYVTSLTKKYAFVNFEDGGPSKACYYKHLRIMDR